MKKYRIQAQGYGGNGPSVPSIESSDIDEVKSEIEDLLLSDHAVHLYEVMADGTKVPVEFYTSTGITIHIEGK